MLEKEEIKPILEALIFAADTALGLDKMANILEGEDRAAIKEALAELVEEYKSNGRGFGIEEVAGGYQYRTNPEYAPWLRRLFKIGLQKISKAAMEALAIVAYKQPVTRGEVESIRGVDSGGVLATLMDKRFIRIAGRKEIPGRPVVYGTTKEFLETFDLKDLSCLPSLKDIQNMEEENGLQNPLPEGEPQARDGGAGQETVLEAGTEERAEAGEETEGRHNEEGMDAGYEEGRDEDGDFEESPPESPPESPEEDGDGEEDDDPEERGL